MELAMPQVYEDDLERNYNLLREVVIAVKDDMKEGQGVPFVKDMEVPRNNINGWRNMFARIPDVFPPLDQGHLVNIVSKAGFPLATSRVASFAAQGQGCET